ncbi:unnamed protein product [Mycena citricolor]|uniref:Fungal-type protein kinase domain-containing protein n=1 Tax=Mycena citricolor TaxID=2018698 RepID=A0AAD2HVJ6_9AGAR|nr:unnamed protein product [Mycena citricolor]
MEAYFRGVISINEMLESMAKATAETEDCIKMMAKLGQPALDEALRSRKASEAQNVARNAEAREKGGKPKDRRRNEQSIIDTMIPYLNKIVQNFPADHKPKFEDTHARRIASADDPADHYTAPDITAYRPGLDSSAPYTWRNIGFVAEVKDSLSFIVRRSKHEAEAVADGQASAPIDDEEIGEPVAPQDEDDKDTSAQSDSSETRSDPTRYRLTRGQAGRKAYVQLGKSARSMLLASGGLHVYLLSIVGRAAFIVRFDTSGWTATPPINLQEDNTVLPRFFLRLYNPPNTPNLGSGRMAGDDFTITPLTDQEKTRLRDALATKGTYASDLESVDGDLTMRSVSMLAVHSIDGPDGKRQHRLVRCFTFGKQLWLSHGLFSRATKVIRVILECDLDKDNPTVYALKDSWRQGCRRPEMHYYDLIDDFRKRNPHVVEALRIGSMAECHGSIDLSLTLPLDLVREKDGYKCDVEWDTESHKTSSILGHPDELVVIRYHTRTLLTPIGVRVGRFKRVKDLVEVIRNGLARELSCVCYEHDLTGNAEAALAHLAGVRHRDISNGNLLVDEILKTGFLLDYDYAEFTPEGITAYKALLESRGLPDDIDLYEEVEMSFTDIIGTTPFLALDLAFGEPVTHQDYHDIESFYWLLIWTILRHTPPELHGHHRYKFAQLFNPDSPAEKFSWMLNYKTVGPPGSPLARLSLALVIQVKEQNRVIVPPVTPIEPTPELASRLNLVFGNRNRVSPTVPDVLPPQKMRWDTVLELFGSSLNIEGWDTMPNDGWVEYIPPSTPGSTLPDEDDSGTLTTLGRESISSPRSVGSLSRAPDIHAKRRADPSTRGSSGCKRRKAAGGDETVGRATTRDDID